EGAMEALVQRGHSPEAAPRFFADTFIDENIGVNRDTNTENDTGDTGQCERCANEAQGREGEQGVEQQRHVSNRAPDAIKELDENRDEYEAHDTGNQTHLDGVTAEVRTNRPF